MAKQKTSPVIQLLDLVYKHSLESTGHSWQRLNSAMQTALKLAIRSGFKFADDDFSYIFSNYNSGYWRGNDVEYWYSLAISSSNDSAWKSYESLKSRKPFIADDITLGRQGDTRVKERLHVGASFEWQGYYVAVTSFAADSESLTVCAYKDRSQTGKPKKRFKITHADLISDRADRKRRKEIMAELTEKHGDKAEEIKARLKAKTMTEFNRVPVSKLEKLLASLNDVKVAQA